MLGEWNSAWLALDGGCLVLLSSELAESSAAGAVGGEAVGHDEDERLSLKVYMKLIFALMF